MKKIKAKGKGFFTEFKEFISRGSIVDMAVGIIIGGAFTAIVTALTGHILTPLLTWALAAIIGDKGLESARTVLIKQIDAETGNIDWNSSVYVDWGAFISAIINFLLIAIVLFLILKAINKARATKEKLEAKELERYYEKHPEERPAPVEPGAPEPTPVELLTEIRDLLKKQK